MPTLAEATETAVGAAPAVRIQGLRKSYGSNEVLKGIDLDVSPGEVIAIIGKSGSGKSTLLRCINGLETFQHGSLTVQGQPLKHDDVAAMRALRQQVGMIFQSFNLFPHLSVGRNVMLAPSLVKKTPAADLLTLARALLQRVGLAEKFDAFPDQLSGGQQQRVAIARALAMAPGVLLCDEITSALDPELVGEVLGVVESLAQEGMTLLMVTHEMNFARKVSNRVIFMHQGRVHEMGPPAALFANPQTAELKQFLSSLHRRRAVQDGSRSCLTMIAVRTHPPRSLDAYIVIGNPNTRKSSLVRCLTGCFNRSVRDIQPVNGKHPLRVYARTGALQETRTGIDDFIAEAARARCSTVLCCLWPSAHPIVPEQCPDALSYIGGFGAAGWRIVAIAVLGQNGGAVRSSKLRQFTQAPTDPINATARAVRAHFGWA